MGFSLEDNYDRKALWAETVVKNVDIWRPDDTEAATRHLSTIVKDNCDLLQLLF